MNPAKVRTTWFTFDGAGRQLTEEVRNILVGAYRSDPDQYDIFNANLTVTKTYDAAGNAVRETDRRGSHAYTYYDGLGRKVLQVDRENYVTRWSYTDNTVTERRYATPVAGAGIGSDPAALVSGLDNGADRIKVLVLDRLGRTVEERVLNVVYGQIDNAATGTYAERTGEAITRRTFDALGNVKTQVDADGRVSEFDYDKLGRQIYVGSGAFTGASGSTVQQRKLIEYNGLGLVTKETLLDANEATTSGDRVTLFFYNKQGQRVRVTDPGASVDYAFDATGNLTYTMRQVRDADNVVSWQGEVMQWDYLGHEVSRQDAWAPINAQGVTGAFSYGERKEVRYNAYGEVTGKRTGGGGRRSRGRSGPSSTPRAAWCGACRATVSRSSTSTTRTATRR